jgi:hypothetical protein
VGDGQSLAPTYSFASATSTGLYNGGSFNFATGCSVAVSGRPRVSFTAVGGPQISLSAQASTHDVDAASFTATLPVTNETSRTGRLVVSVYDFTGAREVFRGDADGTQAKIGFLGASAVAKPTVTGSRGGNAALASLLTALASLGLITDSSTA